MSNLTIVDIASMAGVSISTVSRVLNRHPDVSKKTALQVQNIIDQTGYVPNRTAQSLKLDSARAVGVVIKGIGNPFFARMIQIIERDFHRRNYSVILRQVEPTENDTAAALALVRERKVKGIIFLGGDFSQDKDNLKKLKVPFVLATTTLWEEPNRDFFSSVSVDDTAEAFRAVDYICSAGHSRIGVLAFSERDQSISKLRLIGHHQALEKHGHNLDPSLIFYTEEYSLEAGYLAAKQMLSSTSTLPTCLFCVSDLLALGACRALYEHGLSIQKDISVVGFDGLDMGRYFIPSLTTMKQPDEQMALDAVRILLDSMEHQFPSVHNVYKTELLSGESFRPL